MFSTRVVTTNHMNRMVGHERIRGQAVCWTGKDNSLRGAWRMLIHKTSFCGLSTRLHIKNYTCGVLIQEAMSRSANAGAVQLRFLLNIRDWLIIQYYGHWTVPPHVLCPQRTAKSTNTLHCDMYPCPLECDMGALLAGYVLFLVGLPFDFSSWAVFFVINFI
jgi:hypothetical protein